MEELRRINNHKKAIEIYKEIINNGSLDKLDKWVGWEYADSLKRINKLDEAIDISKEIYKRYIRDITTLNILNIFYHGHYMKSILKI